MSVGEPGSAKKSSSIGKDMSKAAEHQTATSTSQATTPSRSNLTFKFNKSKKETSNTSSNSNSDPTSQLASVTSTPRKKIEKLDYKSGIEILDAYKAKYKQSICLYQDELLGEDEKHLLDGKMEAVILEGGVGQAEERIGGGVEARVENEVEANEIGKPFLRSLKQSIKSKMRRSVEDKRLLIEAENNEASNNEGVTTVTTLETTSRLIAGEDKPKASKEVDKKEKEKEKEMTEKDKKKSTKLKKIVFV